MKRLVQFLREYRLFSLAIVALIVALALQFTHHQTLAHWVLGIVALIELVPLLWGMWQDIRTGTYGVDILAATAIVTSVILGQYWAAIVIVLMLTGGESLEDYAHHRAQSELDALLEHAPQKAHVVRKGKTLDVPVDELRIGEKIIIKPGELVPVDAVILEGEASFDESSLTGESLPQDKKVGDQMLSGSINIDGSVTAKVTATAEESQYQQIVKLVRGAAGSQAPFVRLADRYALPFTVAAYAIATGAWVFSGEAIRFLEVIVVATPCPLILAAPIALISGMARASKYGIIVKTGGALERLAETKSIAFDKTGTLTRGELVVDSITAYGDYTQTDILTLAASLEQNSNHVVAHALVAQAKAKNIKLNKAKHIQEISGRGLRAVLRGQEILIGRLSLLEENNVTLPSSFKHASVNQTAVYIAVGGALAGVVTFKDEPRPEAKSTLARLHELGIRETIMITGDNEATARAVAKSLGIDQVHAEALPADKLRILEQTTYRPIVFVGDGVNDAPALTAADVGIALGARGSTAASESADMVIMLDDVSRVATAYEIAKRTFQIARQSILIGIGLSVALMAIFATGKFSPLTGAIVQEVVDVFVIFNALRAHGIKISLGK
ncbi:MAG: Lead, cadmium, zinc and mercury transporting ATPase [Candidatus Saccharibacteria bacterium]|nr:Lead, cadmium, zinc and mercury transporting ATPase [Candidatus Saccharibacteria bacterium]